MLHVLLALLATAVTSPVATPTDPGDVLLTSLRKRYPDVSRWSVEPLSKDTKAAANSAEVLQIGPRSAVRMGNRVLWYAVAGYQKVVSATHWLPSGAALDERAGRVEEMNVLAASCDPLTDISGLKGSRTTRALQAHAIVCRDAIEPKPPVARGEEVTVKYIGRFVSLRTRGVAQQDGALGDVLEVRSSRDQPGFSAVVSGVNEVTVHE